MQELCGEPLNGFTKVKVKTDGLSASDPALTAHILSETKRDESTSYADNGSI